MLRIKNIVFGKDRPAVCVPVVETDADSVISRVKEYIADNVRMLEWRIDLFLEKNDLAVCLKTLKTLHELVYDTVLLVTYRSLSQGGKGGLSEEEIKLLLAEIASDEARPDLVDVEATEIADASGFIMGLRDYGVRVIASHHCFDDTPSAGEMTELLEYLAETGADIAKLAVMPQDASDVLRLMNVTAEFHAEKPDTPVVTMAMGAVGVVSRLAGELTGSCITFGAGETASAPGQIAYTDLEHTLKVIHKNTSKDKNIYLVGFMGVGKTTISMALQELTGRTVVDTDALIVKRVGMSIPEIFAQKGESFFRQTETQILEELSVESKLIVSCGGGAVLSECNRRLMRKGGRVALITATPEVILERVKNDNNRPLLVGRKTVEGISELLEQRRPNYEKAKDFEVKSDGRMVSDIAKEILSKL
ncbi:MAG: type I 3-dehydroquinate dehydratase [Lachnospiraceae bacterium]|nr:type I 3-dehydroquinate dehydratase [Lachnospiraceae bacterium]